MVPQSSERPAPVELDALSAAEEFVQYPLEFTVTREMEAFEARVREVVRYTPPEHVEWMARWAI